MKTGRNISSERLKGLLEKAYRARGGTAIDDQRWKRRLMTRVEEIGPLKARPPVTATFDLLAWRLAPFTLVMSIILMLLLAGLYLTPRYDGLQLAVRDAKELALREVLGG